MTTPLTNDQYAEQVEALAVTPSVFSPSAYYDADGDCVEFVTRPDAFYAERIDDLVTVYRSQESGDIIGSLIKGVSTFCGTILERLPGFKIEIVDGKVKLAHLFRAKLWSAAKPQHELLTITYRNLIAVAEASGVETEMRAA